MKNTQKTSVTTITITVLRMAVGWHLLYEGLAKLLAPGWSAYGYLSNTTGVLSGFYQALAADDTVLRVVNLLNIYGLILIGLALFVGLYVRYAAMAGALLLGLYYFAYPPFGRSLFSPSAGQLYIVDTIFVETLVMLFFVFSRERGYGIDALRRLRSARPIDSGDTTAPPVGSAGQTRREVVKNLFSLPVLGALGLGVFRRNRRLAFDGLSGATLQVNPVALGAMKGELPKGVIGPHAISRLVLGGNLIGGWTHSRDLIYVSPLSMAYNTEKKIFETLMLAENAGLNAINIAASSNALMAKYKKMSGSRIKVISQVAPNMMTGDYFEQIKMAVDHGSDILQVQGNWCDWLVRDNKIDVIGAMLDNIRGQGFIAGLGAHTIDALIRCEEEGIVPDYYMQTLHHDQYWSAHPRENRIPFEVDGPRHLDHNRFHDNIFCLYPDRTVEFVNRTAVPVMGFKVLAAGAIPPEDGFRWAFENGADFICVGMFDFQIVSDVNITLDVLNGDLNRKRAWCA